MHLSSLEDCMLYPRLQKSIYISPVGWDKICFLCEYLYTVSPVGWDKIHFLYEYLFMIGIK